MLLQPLHSLPHQFWGALQIPLRIADVNMAEISGQQRQSPFGILSGPVPSHEGVRSKTMAQVVQPRTVAVRGAAQTDLPRQRVESSMNLSAIQTIAPTGNK